MGFSEELALERKKLYLREGDVDGAIKEVEGILEHDPNNTKYLLRKSNHSRLSTTFLIASAALCSIGGS